MKTILLVDDSPTVRKVVELTFGGTDIRVEAASSGNEALERIPELRPDLILADISMPEPAGYDICRKVKDSSHPVPVMLLAGTFEPFDAERADDCGADGHLVKPFEADSLVERVETLLGLRAPFPAAPEPETEPEAASVEEGEVEAVLNEIAGEEGVADDSGVLDEPQPAGLSAEDIDRLAHAVARRLTDRVLREVAWEVVPELAERIIRERIRELEREG